ncbi:MAG: fluoride efflux transporter CrcB [Thermoanaerobaculia bacterium]
MRFFWVCVGGAFGSGARYLIAGLALNALGPFFPWGTLIVNVVGSFLLAFLMVIGTETEVMSATLRLTLTTGAMGGFTTYSTFNYESLRYFQEGAWGLGLVNLIGTAVSCLVAGVLGFALARWIVG